MATSDLTHGPWEAFRMVATRHSRGCIHMCLDSTSHGCRPASDWPLTLVRIAINNCALQRHLQCWDYGGNTLLVCTRMLMSAWFMSAWLLLVKAA